MSTLSLVRADAPFGRVLRWIGRLAAAALHSYADRRSYRRMLAMSDHQLRDIGLSRGDVLRALYQPTQRDGRRAAGRALGTAARQRRRTH